MVLIDACFDAIYSDTRSVPKFLLVFVLSFSLCTNHLKKQLMYVALIPLKCIHFTKCIIIQSSIKLVDEGVEGEAVDKLCAWLDLRRVGWIFTDLFTANAYDGSVHSTRHAQSYLLSAEECITAGALQSKYPNPTQFCSDGVYGSKVRGDDRRSSIHIENI